MWLSTPAYYVVPGLLSLAVLAVAPPAGATPNMIRLGYPTCQSCHLSPQGGGLLTSYGEGIDFAQTLRPREPDTPEFGEDDLGARLNYDARLSLSLDRERGEENAAYGFSTSLRTAFGFIPNNRLVYTASVRSPTLARTRTSGAVSISMSRLYWMYQPKQGLQFVVGRDDLPSGLTGLQSFSRRTNNPSVSSTPTQAKVFWWNDRWQVTAYGFGPDGNETEHRFRARGGGAVIGADVWRNRAVVGVTTRVSRAQVFDRTSAGVFARIGFSEHWGVLAEHDVTERTTAIGQDIMHLAGRTEVFYVPLDWLQTALSIDHVTTSGGDDTVRFSPSADVRLTSNIKLGFGIDHVHTPVESRTYSFELQVKTN
jgi:hypothetical protein